VVSFYSAAVRRAACIAVAIAIATTAAGNAHAAPPRHRIVLADPDPELLSAVRSTLAPWKVEVIVDEPPPADDAEARARAEALSARFVVWRRERALVVFDRDLDTAEERESAAGPLDAVDAAGAALTVKTLMRLPPPPPEEEPIVPVAPAGAPGRELRGQAEFATRIARGSTTEIGGRLVAAVLVRPLPQIEWRLGVAVDLGSPASVQRAGFKGTWTDWAVLALTSFTLHHRALEIEPQLGAGLMRSSFEGVDMTVGRHEHATVVMVRAGVTARRRFGRWTVGGALALDRNFGTPTYTRLGSSATIFQVPAFAAAVGVLAAADFGGAGW
jgi:hypothetical protein